MHSDPITSPAFPGEITMAANHTPGLTKLEYATIHILTGLAANSYAYKELSSGDLVRLAAKMAVKALTAANP